jgi:hypothetical protein
MADQNPMHRRGGDTQAGSDPDGAEPLAATQPHDSERHQGEEPFMHVLRNESWRQGRSSRMPVDLGVHFGEGLFRLVESRETSDDSPRRFSV